MCFNNKLVYSFSVEHILPQEVKKDSWYYKNAMEINDQNEIKAEQWIEKHKTQII